MPFAPGLQVPELNVQNGVLKALSFLFEYIGEMGKDYIYAVSPLLEDALMDRDLVHRQTAASVVQHMSMGVSPNVEVALPEVSLIEAPPCLCLGNEQTPLLRSSGTCALKRCLHVHSGCSAGEAPVQLRQAHKADLSPSAGGWAGL